jgi:hypothetical protein
MENNKIAVRSTAQLYNKTIAWLESVGYDLGALRGCPEHIAHDLVPALDRLALVRLMRTTDHPKVAMAALRRLQHEGALGHLSMLKLVLSHRHPKVKLQAAYYLLSQPEAAELHPAVRLQVGIRNLFEAFKEFGPVGQSFDVPTRDEDGWSRRLDVSRLPAGWVFEFNCRGPEATWFQLEQDARFRLREITEEYRAMQRHSAYVRVESEDSAVLTREGVYAKIYRV